MSELESLSTHEKLARHLERHGLDRLIMLCDGVFAIATTLAAVEIHLPEHAPSLAALWDEAGSRIIAYVVSFFVIATFWFSNRDLFARLLRVDRVVTLLTLGMLCTIALIPASNHIFRSEGPGEPSLIFYSIMMVVCGLLNVALWGYAGFLSSVMMPEVPRGFRIKRVIRSAFLPIIFGVMLVVPGGIGLKYALVTMLVIVSASRLLFRWLDRRDAEAIAAEAAA
jgi:uncharacterized membrane protein